MPQRESLTRLEQMMDTSWLDEICEAVLDSEC